MATQTILHVLAGFHERILKLLDVMENCLLLCDEIQELENAMRPMQCIKQFNNSLSHFPTQARRFRDEGAEGEDVDGSLYCLYTFLISRWLVRSRVFHTEEGAEPRNVVVSLYLFSFFLLPFLLFRWLAKTALRWKKWLGLWSPPPSPPPPPPSPPPPKED